MKKILFLVFATVFTLAFTACSDDDDNNEPEVSQPQISILSNGKEISNGQVITYWAKVDELFGDVVAGHQTEPDFITENPCKIEVTITVPQCDIKHLQWCGITHECQNYKAGATYTRTIPEMTSKESMELHAYFKPEVYTDCKVKVDVKVNGKQERSFFIRYSYMETI